VGGDFTEHRHPAPWRVALIADRLSDYRGGPLVLLRGNHDGQRAGVSVVDVLGEMLPRAQEGSSRFAFSRPGTAYLDRVAVCCLPYLDRAWIRATTPELAQAPDAEVYRALGEQFLTIARGLYAEALERGYGQGDTRTVLVVHQALSGGDMTDSQAAYLGDLALVVDTGALAAIGFDAVLAGHFHKHQVLRTDPLVVYAGSPHRVTFAEEHQPKGYLVVDLEPRPATFDFVETPARRFVTLAGSDLDWASDAELEAQVAGAIVRVLDVTGDPAHIRRHLEGLGAVEVGEIRVAPAEAAAPLGLGESTTPADALADYFSGDPDAPALVARGREVLAEVSA
jgi:exonuclease SbcD